VPEHDVGPTGQARGPLIARLALWVLVLATLLVGVILLVTGGIDVWDVQGNTSTFVERIDTRGFGAALICVGILILAAALICELHLPSRARFTVPEHARLSLRLRDDK
jgi:hypothetical protein